jgi:hypothetical protein
MSYTNFALGPSAATSTMGKEIQDLSRNCPNTLSTASSPHQYWIGQHFYRIVSCTPQQHKGDSFVLAEAYKSRNSGRHLHNRLHYSSTCCSTLCGLHEPTSAGSVA